MKPTRSSSTVSNRPVVRIAVWLMLLIPAFAATLFPQFFWENIRFQNGYLHCVMETAMAMISMILGLVLIQRSSIVPDDLSLGMVGSGFFVKSFFALFHAAFAGSGYGVVYHSLATLCGSVGIALVWIRVTEFRSLRNCHRVEIFLAVASLVMAGIIWFMVTPETAVCIAVDGPALFRGVSFISGLLYLCGSVWFIRDFLSSRRRNDVSFIAVCLISAFACLIFPFTDMWSAEWWYLSLLRLAAFGVLLSSVLRGFKQMLIRQRQVEHELLSLVKFPNRNPNPVLRVSVDGEVLYANRASREILPYLCKQENRVTLPDSFGLSFEDLLASGAVVRKELVQGEMAYALDLAPIEDEQVVNIYALDISDKHRAFLDLQRSNRDLEQFAYISSHDLQEPLRMVSNYVQLIERRYKDRLDQDANEFIAFAVDGVRRMSELIEGLLQFSRVQTQGHPLETVDCNRLLETVFRDISVRIHECNAAITVDTLPTVRADRVQLSRIFQNLISNAMKFCDHPPPKIRVSGTELEDHWEFAVADNGIGIDPEYAHKIFGLFKRLHGREKYSGTGIGLAVCKRIIERHGGEIWVESREGGGSVFRFTIHKGGHDEQGSGN